MKYLVGYTGNWIYPIYWNFLASVKGDWFEDLPVVGEKLLAKRINQGIFVFGWIPKITNGKIRFRPQFKSYIEKFLSKIRGEK